MDVTQVNKKIRQYLRFNSINERVDIGLPAYHAGYWYVSLSSGPRIIGTVVLDSFGKLVRECTTPLEEIVDAL